MDTGIDKSVWTDASFSQRFMEADEKYRTAPHTLADRDIATLDAYYGNAAQARRKRDTAIADMNAKAAPRPAAQGTARMREGESLDDFVKRAPMSPTPIVAYHALFKVLKELKDAQDAKRELLEADIKCLASLQQVAEPRIAERINALCLSTDRRLAALEEKATAAKGYEFEARMQRLESLAILASSANENLQDEIKNLQDEIKNLQTPSRGLSWAGEHAAGKSYSAGEFCKRHGSVWLAVKDTTSAPGLSPSDWELVVKAQAQK